MKPRRKAFTLVELLVVISIIALLVSLLLPTLHGAKIQALKVRCTNNLHQICIASFAYATDSAARLPLVGGAFGDPFVETGIEGQVWTNSMWTPWGMTGNMDSVFIQSYGIQTINKCPLKPWDHSQTVPFGFWLPPAGGGGGYNYWEGRGYHRIDNWNEFRGPLKLDGKNNRKVIATDIVYKCLGDGNSLGTGWFSAHAENEMIGFDGSVPLPPSDMNIAFTDGSVQMYAPSQIQYMVYAYVSWYAAGPMNGPD